MKHLLALALPLALAAAVPPARAASPAPAATAPQPAPDAAGRDGLLAAQPGEPVLFPRLLGLRFLASPDQLASPGWPADGVDASRVPLLDPAGIRLVMVPFMKAPASDASLQRLTEVVRAYLRFHGRPFTSVYLPPQDVTGGYVQVVVAEARSAGEVTVSGAKHFSAASYRAVIRQKSGAPIDTAQAASDIAWLNRNPYRHAELSAEPGRDAGTTHLILLTQERLPLSLNAGYSNTGTALTDEDRVSAGLTWGDAFGRGDLLTLGVNGDPAWEHLRGYNAGYTAFLPWRHILSLQGAYSDITSTMPAPFAQHGTSWQVGARYEIPLAAPRPGWTQDLSFTADFKYSDNTLEFAAVPITGNVTHVIQAGASYGLTFPALGGRNSVRLEAVASPGGLSDRNDDAAFAGSRPGAKADYAYARLGLRHQHALGAGWGLTLSADSQFATGALLGSEQLNGGGSSAVRGYDESSAFGDWGVVGSAELHLPPLRAARLRATADPFVFFDAASLNDHRADSTEPRSLGVGVNLQVLSRLSVNFAYGWQLKDIGDGTNSRGHISVNVAW